MAYAYGSGGGGYAGYSRPRYSYSSIVASWKSRKRRSRKKRAMDAMAAETSPKLECCERHMAHDRVGVETSTYGRLRSGLPILRDPGVCNPECPTEWQEERNEHLSKTQRKTQGSRTSGNKSRFHTTDPTGKPRRTRASFERATAERKHPRHQSHESSRSTRHKPASSSQVSVNVPQEEPAAEAKNGKPKNGRGKWTCFSG